MPSFASLTEPGPGIRRYETSSPSETPRPYHERHDPMSSRHWAEYRHPTAIDLQKMGRIRSAAVVLMDVIGETSRCCADQAVAMRKVREAIHAAEDAILLDKRVNRRKEALP